jgi:hypothetical protein
MSNLYVEEQSIQTHYGKGARKPGPELWTQHCKCFAWGRLGALKTILSHPNLWRELYRNVECLSGWYALVRANASSVLN